MIVKSFEIQKKLSNFLKYNLFLLYGENNGLKKDIKDLIKNTLKIKETDIESLSFYESDLINNQENFYSTIYSGSLFGNKKIITINDGTDKIISIINDVLEKYPENILILIFSDQLDKKSKLRSLFETGTKTLCIPCYLDNERDLENIVRTELKKDNIILSRESVNLLIEKSNNDRNNIKNEIEKIRSFALNKKNLDFNEIKSIINFSGEYKSEILVNECLCGNILQYKKILSELYSNTVNQILLLRILANKLQRLLKIKEQQNKYSDLENLLNTSRPPIFWKEKPLVKKQLNIWSLNAVKKALQEINDTELLCKKNPNVSKIIFFSFFTKLCKQASNYS